MSSPDERRLPHQRINFNLRPNKYIERRMIAEVLSRLSRYEDPSRYAYIGMGSYYFADFVMMHKVLGIDTMYSIEYDSGDRERFKFNTPFACVKVLFGTTHDVLPTMDIFQKRPVIAWLDYYGYLDDAKLGDVELVATKCLPGSALIITVNGGTPSQQGKRLEQFKKGLSERNRPPSHSPTSYASHREFSEMCRGALRMRIQATLAARNAGTEKVTARQIFNFRYADGTAMATYGWLFTNKAQTDLLDRDPKLLLTYPVASGVDSVDIEAPTLTFKEIAYLRAKLPDQGQAGKYLNDAKPVARDAAQQFGRLYRYFPAFAHVEE